jgi:hypothetical protein
MIEYVDEDSLAGWFSCDGCTQDYLHTGCHVVKDSWGRQVWMLCANCKHDWDNRKAIRKEWVDAQLVL